MGKETGPLRVFHLVINIAPAHPSYAQACAPTACTRAMTSTPSASPNTSPFPPTAAAPPHTSTYARCMALPSSRATATAGSARFSSRSKLTVTVQPIYVARRCCMRGRRTVRWVRRSLRAQQRSVGGKGEGWQGNGRALVCLCLCAVSLQVGLPGGLPRNIISSESDDCSCTSAAVELNPLECNLCALELERSCVRGHVPFLARCLALAPCVAPSSPRSTDPSSSRVSSTCAGHSISVSPPLPPP